MNKYSNPKYKSIHLYNPKEEGLGLYDVHYINAYKKDKRIKDQLKNANHERYAA